MVAINQASALSPNGPPPHYIVGANYSAPGYSNTGSSIATTANRCYYIPWMIWENHTFTGVYTQNASTTDTGEKYRVMFFNDNGANGGPGTLAKSFGEVTLDNTAALRTLSSSWSPNVGMYWGAIWHDSATDMRGQVSFVPGSNVGAGSGLFPHHIIGEVGVTGMGNSNSFVVAHYVDTAYGAAPSTAVAPTTSIITTLGLSTPMIPNFKLVG